MHRFHGATAVVTGGASGIGAAVVQRLAEEGAAVVAVDRDEARGAALARSLTGRGRRVDFRLADVADEASVARLARGLADAGPAIDVIVNNAGIVRRSSIDDLTEQDWSLQLAVNLKAPLLVTRALSGMLRVRGGAVVNVSSEGAFRPRPLHAAYDVSKAGVGALTRAMAAEYAEFGIRVNAVAPGWIVTEMHFAAAEDPASRRREMEALDHDGCLMRRLGRPDEVAAVIAFLASSDASYLTATTVHVDGGQGLG